MEWLVSGVHFKPWYTVLFAAAILGFFNAILRPILLVLTLPITLITFGLFVFVINAILFWLTAILLPGFSLSGIWAAFVGALLYALLGVLVHGIMGIGESSTREARA